VFEVLPSQKFLKGSSQQSNPVEPPQTLALCTVSARGDMLHLDDGGIFAAARAVDPLHSGGDLHPLQIEVSCFHL